MKIYHYALMFVAVTCLMFTMVTVALIQRQQMTEQTVRCRKALDKATKACADVIGSAGESGIYGVRDNAEKVFFTTLAAEMGLTGYSSATKELELHVPLLIICDESGYYVRSNSVLENADHTQQYCRVWSEHLNYDGEWPETLPEEEGIFQRASAKKGVYAFYKGAGTAMLLGKQINCISFAEMGIVPTENFYINISGDGYASSKYYHKEKCVYRGERSMLFQTERECAQHGAYSCPYCFNCPDYGDYYGGR